MSTPFTATPLAKRGLSISTPSATRPSGAAPALAPLKAATPLLDGMCAEFLARDDLQGFGEAEAVRHRILGALCEGRTAVAPTGVPQHLVAALEKAGLTFDASEEVAPPSREPFQADVKPLKPSRRRQEAKDGPELSEAMQQADLQSPRSESATPRRVTLPPPPDLSGACERISATMIKGIPQAQVPAALARRVNGLLAAIQEHPVADEKVMLLAQMRSALFEVGEPVCQSPEWQIAIGQLELAEFNASPAMASLRKQASTGLAKVALLLRAAEPDRYNPNAFSTRMPMAVEGMLQLIRTHEKEAERFALLAHLAQTLSDMTRTADMQSHPEQHLRLSTLLVTVVRGEASGLGANDPGNRELATMLAQLLKPHQAHVQAHTPEGLRSRILSALQDRPADYVAQCIAIVRSIGVAPLSPRVKQGLIDEFQTAYENMCNAVTGAGRQGESARLAAEADALFGGLRDEFRNSARWSQEQEDVRRSLRPYMARLDARR